MLPQQIYTQNDTILAKRETLYAVVARRTKRLPAAVALHDRNVLDVIGTIHLYLLSST
jgi:hypothetical protein